MDRPRICVLMPTHWSAGLGGAEMQVQLLVDRLVATDQCELHFVARASDPAYRPRGYTLHRLEARRAIAGTFLLDLPVVAQALELISPDIIYQRVGGAQTAVAAWWARRHGRRMVWHVSSNNDLAAAPWRWTPRAPFEMLDRQLIDCGARHAGGVIVQTREQAALLSSRFGRHDAMQIPNFHPAPAAVGPKPADRVTICWIANVKELKRPELFLKLADDLRDRADLEFVMLGSRQMGDAPWSQFERLASGTGNVTYLGHRPQSEVNALLDRAHLLVNTSTYEGFPNTFIQAWLREVPVVSLKVNPDGVFNDGHLGVCANDDFGRFRQAVRTLADDPGQRRALGRKAALVARQKYSLSNIDRVVEVLRNAGAGRGRRE